MRELKIHGIYRHFKGDLYLVEDIATHSETKEKYVSMEMLAYVSDRLKCF